MADMSSLHAYDGAAVIDIEMTPDDSIAVSSPQGAFVIPSAFWRDPSFPRTQRDWSHIAAWCGADPDFLRVAQAIKDRLQSPPQLR